MHLFLRCTAPQSDLNKTDGVTRRCQEHTELLVSEFELGLLWDGWGIVGDVVVRLSVIHFFCVFLFFVCFIYYRPLSHLPIVYDATYSLAPITLSPITQLYLTLSHTAIHK
jgi:hypothetical protein